MRQHPQTAYGGFPEDDYEVGGDFDNFMFYGLTTVFT